MHSFRTLKRKVFDCRAPASATLPMPILRGRLAGKVPGTQINLGGKRVNQACSNRLDAALLANYLGGHVKHQGSV
jgi:hypothetical protein